MRERHLWSMAICVSIRFAALVHAADVDRLGLAQTLLEVGLAKRYEVVTPSPGYPGGPHTIGAFPTRREPTQRWYVRIEVLDQRVAPQMTRIVLRVDETDREGNVTRKAPYFAYLDVLSEGAVMVCKRKDDGKRYRGYSLVDYMPFPLDASRPPLLASQNASRTDGYYAFAGGPWGVAYEEGEPTEDTSVVEVQATLFALRPEPSRLTAPRVMWYGPEIAEVLKDPQQCAVAWRETQRWKSRNDWLWTEMERRRDDGVLMMRCKEIGLESADKK